MTLMLCALLSLPQAAEPGWSQWLGPNRDGRSPETGLLKAWPAGGPPLAWKRAGLGAGFSSVVTAGDLLLAMGDVGGACTLIALKAVDGAPAWTARIGEAGGKRNAGPRSTPAADAARVYALGQAGELVCVERSSGKEVWRRHLEKDFGGDRPNWWWSESPLLDGEHVIVTPGGRDGAVAALRKEDGKTAWRSAAVGDRAQYASLVPSELGGVRHYVLFSGERVAGIAAKDGALLWSSERRGRTAMCSSPLVKDDWVFVSSAYGIGHAAFRVTADGGRFASKEAYAGKELESHHGGMVLVGDHVYGLGQRALVCVELKTGKVAWENRSVGKGSIAYADGHLIVRAEQGAGTIALVEATPEAYREKGRFDPPDRSREPSWAYPVIAGGRLYVRDQDVLLAYDVRAK
jgi:outer membrane protein assembly factor BamB